MAKDVTKKATNEVIDEAIAEDTNKAVVIDVKEEKSSEKSGSLRKREISNNNQMILDLYAKGKTNIEIAKELGLGIGEVRLVIDLFNSR